MTSLTLLAPNNESEALLQNQQLRQHINGLDKQIDTLNKIIKSKDTLLEGISNVFTDYIRYPQLASPSLIQISEKVAALQQQNLNSLDKTLIASELVPQVDGIITNALQALGQQIDGLFVRNQKQMIFLKKAAEEYQLQNTKKQMNFDMSDTYNQILKQINKQIYEIPVQIAIQKNKNDYSVQVDLFETPVNSAESEDDDYVENYKGKAKEVLILERPVQMRQFYEIPVEVLEVYEIPVILKTHVNIPVEMMLIDDENNTNTFETETHQIQLKSANIQKKSVELIEAENSSLSRQIQRLVEQIKVLQQTNQILRSSKQIAYQFEVEVDLEHQKGNDYFQTKIIEVPVELILQKEESKEKHDQVGTRSELEDSGHRQILQTSNNSLQQRLEADHTKEQLQNILIIEDYSISQRRSSLSHSQNADHLQVHQLQAPLSRMSNTEQISSQTEQNIDRVIERIIKVPVLKTVQVISQIQVPKLIEIPTELFIEVDRIRYIQVPIIKQVIVQKLIQKLVQVPVIRQVPIQVLIQKIVENRNIVVHQIPKETLVVVTKPILIQKIVEVVKEISVPAIRETPVECIIQIPIIQEVPVEIFVDRIIQKERIVEVETLIEKIVEIEKEVIKEVIVQKIVEVEKIVEVQKIVQKIVEVEKRVSQPLLALAQQSKVSLNQQQEKVVLQNKKPSSSNLIEEQAVVLRSKSKIQQQLVMPSSAVSIVQIPIQLQIQVDVQKIKQVTVYVDRIVQVQKIVYIQKSAVIDLTNVKEFHLQISDTTKQYEIQLPILNNQTYQIQFTHSPQVNIQYTQPKIVEVEKIVQKIVEVEKIVYVEVQKIIEKIVNRVVEVPIEIFVDRIVQKQIAYLVEIPVELQMQQQIVQIPVQIHFQPCVYEVPVILQTAPIFYQIPIQVQRAPLIVQVPIQIDIEGHPLKIQTNQSPIQSPNFVTAIFPNENQQPIIFQSVPVLNQEPIQNMRCYQVPFAIDAQTGQLIIDTDKYLKANEQIEEIVIQINLPQEEEINKEKESRQLLEMIEDSDDDLLKLQNGNRLNVDSRQGTIRSSGTNAIKTETGVILPIKIVQIPVEVELNRSEQLQQMERAIQEKYREYMSQLNEKYQVQINSLHDVINDFRKVVTESNAKKDQHQFISQEKELQVESLRNQSRKNQEVLNEQNNTISGLKKQIEELHMKNNLKVGEIISLKEEIQFYRTQPTQLIKIVQLPVQLIISQIRQVPIEVILQKHISEQPKQSSDKPNQLMTNDNKMSIIRMQQQQIKQLKSKNNEIKQETLQKQIQIQMNENNQFEFNTGDYVPDDMDIKEIVFEIDGDNNQQIINQIFQQQNQLRLENQNKLKKEIDELKRQLNQLKETNKAGKNVQENVNNKLKEEVTILSAQVTDLMKSVSNINILEQTNKILIEEHSAHIEEQRALMMQAFTQQKEEWNRKEINYKDAVQEREDQFNYTIKLLDQSYEEIKRLQASVVELRTLPKFLQMPIQVNTRPFVYELPVELSLDRPIVDATCQTEQNINLFQKIQLLEVPIEISIKQKLGESALRQIQLQSSQNQKSIKNQQSPTETQQKLFKLLSFKRELLDQGIQTDIISQSIQFEIPQDHQIQKLQQDQGWINRFQSIDRGSIQSANYYKDNLVSGIQFMAEYQTMLQHIKIYEVVAEVIPQPVVYEVPIDVKVFKEISVSEVQTDVLELEGRIEIVELPCEMVVVEQLTEESPNYSDIQRYVPPPNTKQRSESGVQGAKLKAKVNYNGSQVIQREPTVEQQDDKTLKKHSSQHYKSRLIEIPIEIIVDRDLQSIQIQTIIYNQVNCSSQTNIPEYDYEEHSTVLKFKETIVTQDAYISTERETINHLHIYKAFDPIQVLEDKPVAQSHEKQLIVLQQQASDIVLREQPDSRNQSRLGSSIENQELNFKENGFKNEGDDNDEQKINYQQLYEQTLCDLEQVKNQLHETEIEMSALQFEFERNNQTKNQYYNSASVEIANLERINKRLEDQIQGFKVNINENMETKVKLQKKAQKLYQNCQKIKQESDKTQSTLNRQIQRLRNIITDQLSEMRELKADDYHNKQIYQLQMAEFKELLQRKAEYIDQMEQELQHKNDKLEQLVDSHEEMRKNITLMCRNQVDPASIYEQEFERVKETFEQQKLMLAEEIASLKNDILQLKDELSVQTKYNADLQKENEAISSEFIKLKQQNSQLHHVKSQLQNNYVEDVQDINNEVEQLKKLIYQKDQIIQQLQCNELVQQPGKLNAELHQSDDNKLFELTPTPSTPSRIRMEYLSKQVSRNCDEGKQQFYIKKLQNLILKYEKMLLNDQIAIEDLQQKVFEYLRDALQKQQQAQFLFLKVLQLESTISNILVQKVTLEIQNKRMYKAIELSQRKLSILGTKLLQVTKKRTAQTFDSQKDEEGYYYG